MVAADTGSIASNGSSSTSSSSWARAATVARSRPRSNPR
jgi:hypothetical protein